MKSESKDFVLVAGTYILLVQFDLYCVLCAVNNFCDMTFIALLEVPIKNLTQETFSVEYSCFGDYVSWYCTAKLSFMITIISNHPFFDFYTAKGMGGLARWFATC